MKFIKLNDFLKLEIKPFLLGAFLSRIMDYTDVDGKSYFYAYSRFRNSKVVYQSDFDLKNYAKTLVDSLNKHSGHYNWEIFKAKSNDIEIRFYILNNLNMSKDHLYRLLHQKTLGSDWGSEEGLNEEKKDFIRGFMELRGSVDTTSRYIAQDYFYNNRLELKKAQILTDFMNLPIEYANFNARDLQPQFVSGENKRNTQFRINAFYYASNIGFINHYKGLVFEKAYYTLGKETKDDILYYQVNMPKSNNYTATFIRYLNFFTNNIYEKELTKEAIQELRQQLNFDSSTASSKNRSGSLIKLFTQITPDECAICNTKKTYINKSTGRQHFEIHHVISFHNNQNLDNIANLVKLCPNCHDMLKKNRTTKDIQIKGILKILHDHQEIFEFTSSYLGIDDINQLADKIWSMLG